MPIIDHLFSFGILRKAIWKFWYPFLTKRLHGEAVVFLNYAFETEPPMGIPLRPEDEPNRACIQLYHHVASQVNLQRLEVLEVGCGHGGGASYIARTFKPARYVGLDLNPAGIAFCQKNHEINGLEFIQGDAGKLPFPDASFDAVVNVETSHCYPDFPRFLSEVARVLRPGGVLLYADFRFSESFTAWENALENAPLRLMQSAEISAEVLRGMDRNSAYSQELLDRKLPGFMTKLGRDFAGVTGSRVHAALQNGEVSYRSYCFRKPFYPDPQNPPK